VSLDKTNSILQLARSIVEDSVKLTDTWAQLDYHAKYGTLREEKDIKAFNVEDLELWEIITRLLTLPSFITKSKQKMSRLPEGQEKEELSRIINLKVTELDAIKELRHKKN
jgi:hypothetical protein